MIRCVCREAAFGGSVLLSFCHEHMIIGNRSSLYDLAGVKETSTSLEVPLSVLIYLNLSPEAVPI